jgi:hypothetical protein
VTDRWKGERSDQVTGLDDDTAVVELVSDFKRTPAPRPDAGVS